MSTGEDGKIYVTDVYPFRALNPIRQTGGEGRTPRDLRRVRGWGEAAKDGEKGNKKRATNIILFTILPKATSGPSVSLI